MSQIANVAKQTNRLMPQVAKQGKYCNDEYSASIKKCLNNIKFKSIRKILKNKK